MKKPDSMEFTFESLDNTDRIVVTTNLNQRLALIEDPETIGAVLALVKEHRDGWTVPPGGVPIARRRLNFYQGDRILGNVGVGKTFLTAHQFGGFYSKAVDEAVRNGLFAAVGLSEQGSS